MMVWNGSFLKKKLVKTGNPVRQDLLDIENKVEEGIKYFNLRKAKKHFWF